MKIMWFLNLNWEFSLELVSWTGDENHVIFKFRMSRSKIVCDQTGHFIIWLCFDKAHECFFYINVFITELQIRCVKITSYTLLTLFLHQSMFYFDHLSELSGGDDSNKGSNVWFGEEIGIIEIKIGTLSGALWHPHCMAECKTMATASYVTLSCQSSAQNDWRI